MPGAPFLIEGATFEPEVAKTLGEVFNAEWTAIQPAFDGWRLPAVEAARTSLARVTVHIARRGVTEPEELRARVHLAMKRTHAALADHHGKRTPLC